MSPSRSFLLFLAAVALVPGCKRKEIRVFIAPKDPPAAAAKSPDEEPANLPRQQRPKVSFEKPEGWSDTEPGAFSAVNFVIEADGGRATVSVTPLGNFSGKEPIVVNMWRGQVGLPELPQEEAAKTLASIKVGGREGKIFEVAGTLEDKPCKIFTAMVDRGGATWFYKLEGDEKVVDAQKPAFLKFIQTVRPEGEETGGAEPTASSPPAPEPAAPAATASAAAPAPEAEPKPRGIPAGWQPIKPGPMQAAKFAVPDQGAAKAEVSVSVFGSDTGGALANVNRWRGQVGLEPVDEAGLAAIIKPIPGLDGAILADFSKESRRMVGAIVPRGGQWWFYKLLGDADAVAAAESTFKAFVQAPPQP